ncbi:transglutaminase-like domain-containing protein [Rathayibacter sp. YIM 133350]|uniref:transglutaminase-like domain-containing protein n=1 Tax=Rathayibacter sp. YIM 133350 TaxID=3131992 RepID=UPI00307D302F
MVTRVRLSGTTVLGNAVALTAAIGLAVLTLWPVYESPAFVWAVLGSALAGMAIAVLGARYRWSALIVLFAVIGCYLLIGVPLGIPSLATFGILPTPQGITSLLVATAESWKQLLTIVTPVGSYQALLVPVVILVLVTASVGMSVALRARRPELAALCPLVLYVAAIAFGPTSAQAPVLGALGLGVVLVLWSMWIHRRRRARAIALMARRGTAVRESTARRSIQATRTLAGALVVVAIAVAGGAAGSAAYPVNDAREVLRRHTVAPFDPRDYPSPLSAFRSYLQADRADATMMTVSGLPAGGRVRLAALDTYDGVVYSVGSAQTASASGSFTRLPYRLDQSAVRGRPVSIGVSIGSYEGVWVPGAGRLESIHFDDPERADAFFYNDNAGTGAVIGGLSRGDSYQSSAVVPAAADQLAALRPGTAVLPPLPAEPDGVAEKLASWVDPDETPGNQLAAMVAGIKREGYVSHGLRDDEPVSRSGHAADRIAQLVQERPMVGDGEQYSVLAALMARMIGFPARVVMGFAPTVAADSGSVAIKGSDVSAWIEVQDEQGSWVGIDPNPEPRPIPAPEPDQPNVVSRPQVVVPPPPAEPPQSPANADPQRNPGEEDAALDPFLAVLLVVAQVLGWVVLVGAILLSPFVAIVAAKLRRRRLRRSGPTPTARIEGGWREFTDSALDRGFGLSASATRSEAAAVVGGIRPLVLAASVDRAVFAPEPPTTDDVEAVWRDVDVLRADLDERLTRWQRIRAAVSLRSFRRYIGTGKEGS